jgi:aminopeptidase N
VSLIVQANPRQTSRGRNLAEQASAILEYYTSILGDAPYPSFTLAVAESDLPGGHSPAYFAVLNQTLPMAALVWRNDPVSFDNYPSFFLAHEVAHQWWGQAIGWKNYHEQWISEGFAQYFAALYAERERGGDLLRNLMRQMRKWGIEQSDQGPVYLGYRLGHIKADGRVFRAVVYNKAAMVLHMLRRFIGDEAFFAGLRQFYSKWRFRKAGTEDFRAAMEAAGGRDLGAFFEAWIYRTDIPELRFSYEAGPSSAILRFEHRREVMPVPVTVTITYAAGEAEEVVVPVLERSVERTVPLKGPVRSIEANRDNAALAEFTR